MQVTQETTIGGNRFAVSQLPGMASLKLLPRLGKVLGPAIGKAAAALPKGKDAQGIQDLDVATLGEALPALFDRLDPDELEDLTKTLLAQATVDGRPLMREFDLTMQGRAFDILKLVWFSLEVNYGNFFVALARGGFVPGLTGQSPSAASTISSLNGQPGVS